MKCPNCSETLVMTERQGIEIDYCPKCRGVWLDTGELDKIIDRSVPGVTQELNPEPEQEKYRYESRDDYRQKEYQNKRRKKGFLGDLFDFD